MKKKTKFFKKSFKNPLTNPKSCAIIIKSPDENGKRDSAEREEVGGWTSSLKIEQYEERINITLSILWNVSSEGESPSEDRVKMRNNINSGETKKLVFLKKINA